MGVSDFHELYEHAGHQVEVATYGKHGKTVNVAIECTDCNVVLLDFDRFPEEHNSLADALEKKLGFRPTTTVLEHPEQSKALLRLLEDQDG